jgi:hypothetical protein
MQKIRAIITGASGMVGEGVLWECLLSEEVESVLVIGRRACGHSHPKMKEVLIKDFFDLSSIENDLSGYNATFFCLGVSSIGMNEEQYTNLTYDLTMNFAYTVLKQNKEMQFCYVSGGNTDSTEKGKIMWARVKGKTENDLINLSFKNVYVFRPGFMKATAGLKNTLKYYKYFAWLAPVLITLFPKHASTLRELGEAMINSVIKGSNKKVLEVLDIVELAKK